MQWQIPRKQTVLLHSHTFEKPRPSLQSQETHTSSSCSGSELWQTDCGVVPRRWSIWSRRSVFNFGLSRYGQSYQGRCCIFGSGQISCVSQSYRDDSRNHQRIGKGRSWRQLHRQAWANSFALPCSGRAPGGGEGVAGERCLPGSKRLRWQDSLGPSNWSWSPRKSRRGIKFSL